VRNRMAPSKGVTQVWGLSTGRHDSTREHRIEQQFRKLTNLYDLGIDTCVEMWQDVEHWRLLMSLQWTEPTKHTHDGVVIRHTWQEVSYPRYQILQHSAEMVVCRVCGEIISDPFGKGRKEE